jgi:hypothetical protein
MRLIIIALSLFALFISPAGARGRGACDGIHRCTCGSTQARHFGYPRIYNGHNLWEAREWARAFPHTSIHAGAVGVYPHHVFRVIEPLGNGRAIVADEKGQYERRISGAVFVDASGNRAFAQAESRTHDRVHASKHRIRYASAGRYLDRDNNSMDRLSLGAIH